MPTTALTLAGGAELEMYTGDNGSLYTGGAHVFEPLRQTLASLTGATTSIITLNAGTLTIDNVAGNTSTHAGLIRENGDGGSTLFQTLGNIIKSGAGTLVLSNTGNSYTGVTIVNGGTLQVASLSNGGLPSSMGASSNAASNLILDAAALRYSGANTSTDRLFTVGSGGATLTFEGSSGSGSINFTNAGALVMSGSGNRTLTLNSGNTGSSTMTPIIPNPGSGVTSLLKVGTGRWVLGGANTYTGDTTINDGTLAINASERISNSSNLIVDGLSAVFDLTASHTETVAGVRLDGAALITGSGASALTLTAGSFDLRNGTVSGVSLTGAFGVLKSTAANVVINSTNTYTGPTTITGGTLFLSLLANGGANSGIGAAGSIASNLVVDGGTFRYTGAGVSIDRLFTVGSAGATLSIGGGGTGNTINFSNAGLAAMSGSGDRTLTLDSSNSVASVLTPVIPNPASGVTSLTKTGTGRWSLAGSNSYTGETTVTDGTLMIAASERIGNSSTLVVDGSNAKFDLGASHTETVGGVRVDNGGQIVGTGTSNIVVNTGNYDLRNGTVFVPLNGSAGLVKSTAGTATLTVNNAYTGPTVIDGGLLTLETSAGAISGTTSITINSGATLRLNNVDSASNNSNRINNSAVVALSGGTLNFVARRATSGNHTQEAIGRIAIEDGASTLSLAGSGSSGALPTNGVMTISLANGLSRAPGSTLRYIDDSNAGVYVSSHTETGGLVGPWMLYDNTTFAGLSGTNLGLVESVGTTSNNINTSVTTSNVGTNAAFTTTGIRSANTLAITGAGSFISTIAANNSIKLTTGGLILEGSDNASTKQITGSGTLTAGGNNELVVHTTNNTTTASHVISAVIANDGANVVSLTKGGIASLTLSGANTYTGATYVAEGNLLLSSSTSNNTIGTSSKIIVHRGATLDVTGVTASGGFKLGLNQTLGGNGSVIGAVTANAGGSTFAPGTSIGQLTFTGNNSNVALSAGTNFATASTLELEFGAPTTPGVTYDQFVVSGSSKVLTLGGAKLKLIGFAGLVTGQPYEIIRATGGASITGLFANLAGNLIEGGSYTDGAFKFGIDYEPTYVRVTFSAVPEPSSAAALLALGAPSLLRRRRRKQKCTK
jgi:fibronectin-binding autotransporter adhesin